MTLEPRQPATAAGLCDKIRFMDGKRCTRPLGHKGKHYIPYPMRREPAVEAEAADASGLRAEVAAFANLMERVLRENDHKGGWKRETGAYLLRRLREEVDELEAAGADPIRKHREAADVANFAMMIADVTAPLAASAEPAREPAYDEFPPGHLLHRPPVAGPDAGEGE